MSKSAIYILKETLSATMPWAGPQKTDGTQIFAETFCASSDEAEVKIEFDAQAGHASGAFAMVVCLFVDEEQYPRRTSVVTSFGANYFSPMNLRYSYTPSDTEPHTYRIRVGSVFGSMRLNGLPSGESFADMMASTLFISEM